MDLLNPTGWTAIILSTLLTGIIGISPNLARYFAAKWKLRSRKAKRQQIIRFKEVSADSLLLQREIVSSGVYQAICILSGMVFLCSLPLLVAESPKHLPFVLMLSLPIYIYEVMWLKRRDFLNDLAKWRKKKAQRTARRLAPPPLPKPKATRRKAPEPA